MMPASTKGGGQCFAAPDTCLTPAPPAPPVPIPYPNIGLPNQADKTTPKVKFCGKEVITTNSEIPRTSGDEAGVNKGVMSGTNMDRSFSKRGVRRLVCRAIRAFTLPRELDRMAVMPICHLEPKWHRVRPR